MKISNIDHLNLSVRDFDETVAWYGRVFGFELVEHSTQADGVRFGILRSEDAMLCIYEHAELEHPSPDLLREKGYHAIRHFGLRIRDREAWEATIAREQLSLDYGGEIAYAHSSSWYVKDPTGWSIEVALWEDDRIAFG